ncbi:electron transfer flavoprotein subunit beta/FixA family protein [Acidimicrobiia bacterium]|jgi:electron transfer flavoprotein beta subunit|nr:electron transfer flavoprotein subunit beta/FixA family protein [Acidimicrobiia bacterium]|tara:strand:- start:17432 stop:18181 length:750 start_codon:yes stop_codon:yes gene_type:complete
MKIAVCAKQIPDPAIAVSYEGGAISRPEEQVLDDTDRYGIEVALQLKEKFDAEVIVLSMGKLGTQKGIQQALQMGADKALVIEDDSLVNANSLMTSNVLSSMAKSAEADIIIFGTESSDGYSGVVPQQVSRYLNLPCISYVKGIEINDDTILTRQTITGSEKVTMPDKCVISVTASGVEPRYPNFKDIMAAKSKPVEVISISSIELTAIQNQEFVEINSISSDKSGEKHIDEGNSFNLIIEKLKEIKAI